MALKLTRNILLLTTAILLASYFLYNTVFRPKTIKIGFIANLSGRSSHLGVNGRNGTQLAVDEINQRGGINGRLLELLEKDNRGNKKTCFEVTKELIDSGVSVIIGPYLSSMAGSVIAAAGDKSLIISPTVSTDRLSGKDDYFLRINASASKHGAKLAEASLKNNNRALAIVKDGRNADYADAVAQGFKIVITQTNAAIVSEISFTDKSEFEIIANKLKHASPDGILFAAAGIDVAAIVQQYAKLASLPNLYSSTWSKATKVHEYGGRTVEGMFLVAAFENDIIPEPEAIFNKKYKKAFRTEPNFASIYSFEAVQIFSAAAQESDSFHPAAIKQAILGMQEINGIRDIYHLDQFGDAVRNQSIFTIKDNTYVLAEIP